MNLTVEFSTPVIGMFDWQVNQEINVLNSEQQVIAKAEIELLTLNKHRGAEESYVLLDEQGATDWELPLNLYFKKQNLHHDLAEKLAIKSDSKAKTHIMLEALSVLPAYRKQGIAKYLLKAIAEHYPKVQSITVLSLPMQLFVDVENCQTVENKAYYQALDLTNDDTNSDSLTAFFTHLGFINFQVDEQLLNEPLPFNLFVSSPQQLQQL